MLWFEIGRHFWRSSKPTFCFKQGQLRLGWVIPHLEFFVQFWCPNRKRIWNWSELGRGEASPLPAWPFHMHPRIPLAFFVQSSLIKVPYTWCSSLDCQWVKENTGKSCKWLRCADGVPSAVINQKIIPLWVGSSVKTSVWHKPNSKTKRALH